VSVARFFNIETLEAPRVEVHGLAVTPLARRLTIMLPFFVLSYARPAAVRVEGGEIARRIPVIDWTRAAQGTLLGLTFVGCLLIGRVAHRNTLREERRE
jgi:hypothetical protein